jgi:hypothetical chaperone protein
MSITFGLDFGTSNSSLAANVEGHVELLDIDKDNPIKLSLKSVLYFLKDKKETKSYIGYEAVKKYIETEAAGRYMQSIKSFLPDETFEKTEIFNKYYELEELIGFILRTIKKRGEQILNHEVSSVVLGRPVLFSEDVERDQLAEKRLLKAAQLAGFEEIIFQLEPVAAALSFENNLGYGEEKNVLVGDFGAGTSDFTILRASKNYQNKPDRSADILSTEGVYIGGDLFDADIMWEKVCKYYGKDVSAKSPMSDNWLSLSSDITTKLKHWNLIPLLRSKKTLHNISNFKYLTDDDHKHLIQNLENLIKDNYGYMLFQAIEKAKCELSNSTVSDIFMSNYDILIDECISRGEFEEYITDKVIKINECVQSVIKKAGISQNEIGAVFLTGGSSYIPLIQKVFEDKFDLAIIKQSDAFTSVAYGLGLHAKLLS